MQGSSGSTFRARGQKPAPPCSLALFIGYGAVVYYLFVAQGVWFNLVYPWAAVLQVYEPDRLPVFHRGEAGEDIRRMFSSYVSKRIVDELIRDPSKAKLGGARKEITVLFSDIRGFTTFSERHEPEEVVSMLNEIPGRHDGYRLRA